MGEDVAIEAMEEVARVRVDELTRSVEDVCDCPAGEQKTEEAFFCSGVSLPLHTHHRAERSPEIDESEVEEQHGVGFERRRGALIISDILDELGNYLDNGQQEYSIEEHSQPCGYAGNYQRDEIHRFLVHFGWMSSGVF